MTRKIKITCPCCGWQGQRNASGWPVWPACPKCLTNGGTLYKHARKPVLRLVKK